MTVKDIAASTLALRRKVLAFSKDIYISIPSSVYSVAECTLIGSLFGICHALKISSQAKEPSGMAGTITYVSAHAVGDVRSLKKCGRSDYTACP